MSLSVVEFAVASSRWTSILHIPPADGYIDEPFRPVQTRMQDDLVDRPSRSKRARLCTVRTCDDEKFKYERYRQARAIKAESTACRVARPILLKYRRTLLDCNHASFGSGGICSGESDGREGEGGLSAEGKHVFGSTK